MFAPLSPRGIAPLFFPLLLVTHVAHADVDPGGRFTQEIAIAVPAFHDLTPKLALRYSSGAGNGFAGVGWTLDVGSKITRVSQARGIPRGDTTDRYVLDGIDLVPCVTGSASPSCTTAELAFGSSAGFFSTKIESYQRIRQDAAGWTIWGRDGTQRTFKSDDAGQTFTVSDTSDSHGNRVHATAWCDGVLDCYPDTITYANSPTVPGAQIRFVREARPDKLSRAHGGGLGTMRYRLHAVVVTMDGQPLRTYQLAYHQSLSTGASLVSSIEQLGRDGQALPAMRLVTRSMQDAGYTESRPVTSAGLTKVNLPDAIYEPRFPEGLEVTYNAAGYTEDGTGEWDERPHGQELGDFDGDGRMDWLAWAVSNADCTKLDTETVLMTKTGARPVVHHTVTAGPGRQSSLPSGQRCRPRLFVSDLDGDRRDDLLMLAGGKLTQIVAQSGGSFYTPHATQAWPSSSDECTFVDVDGDGRDDLVCTGTDNGAFKLTIGRPQRDGTWQVSNDSLAGLGVQPGQHLIAGGDFNGDGLGDVTIASHSSGQWTLLAGASDGAGNFTWTSQPTTWAASILGGELSARDVDGDGRSDVVLVQGGRVSTGLATKGASLRYRTSVAARTWPGTSIGLGDYDGDGRIDVLLRDTQTWARGRGDGQFDAPNAGSAITRCDPLTDLNAINIAVFTADLNGDGRSDILCTNDDFPTYTLRDRMTAAFADHPLWIQGDIDGDGSAELIHISHLSPGTPGYMITTVSTLTQVKSNFELRQTNNVRGFDEPDVGRFLVMDVGSPTTGEPDGKADLVLVDSHAGSLRVYALLSRGDGTFEPRVDTPWRDANGAVASYAPVDLQHWRIADLDGDGRGDLIHPVWTGYGVYVETLRARGDGTWFASARSYFASVGGIVGHDSLVADVSGDGISDLVHVEPGTTTATVRVLLGNGDSTFSERASTYASSYRDLRRIKVGDFNGDGLADLVHLARGGAANASRIDLAVSLSDGNGGWQHGQHSITWSSNVADEASLLEDTNLARFIDIDGDGRADLVHLTSYLDAGGWPATAIVVAHNPGAEAPVAWTPQLTKGLQLGNQVTGYDHDPWRWQAWTDPYDGDPALIYIHPTRSQAYYFRPARDRLRTIDNGTGGVTKVTYTPLLGRRTYLPEGSLPTVVNTIEVRDEVATPAISELLRYSFGEARYSIALGRMGFGWSAVSDHDSIELTRSSIDDSCGVRTTQVQHQSLTASIDTYVQVGYVPSAGVPARCDRNLVSDYECMGTGNCRLARNELLELDAFGNTVSSQVTADQSPATLTYRPHKPNATSYIIDKPAYEARYGSSAAGLALLSLTTFGYDGNAFNVGPGARGDLREINRYDGNAGVYRTTQLTYGTTGLVESTVDPLGQIETISYDARYGLFPARSCSGKLCRDLIVDPVSGLTTDVTDDNAAHTEMHYDSHGRLIWTKRPSGGTTETKYLATGVLAGSDAQRQRIRTEISDGSAKDGVLWTETFYDGLGRTYRVNHEGGATQDTQYSDASVHPRSISNTYATGGSTLAWTTFDYDAAGRVVRTITPDTYERRTSFLVGKTTGTDQSGHTKTAYTDGHGRVIRIEEHDGATTITTRYAHDGAGRLRSITDHLGNVTTIDYDLLGHQVATNDPDRGSQSFTYLANGLLATTTDAQRQMIRYQYDGMGRRAVREDVDDNGTVVRTVTWRYDYTAKGQTSGASMGRLVELTDQQRSALLTESYVYDVSGHANETRRCIDSTCMAMRATYDLAERLELLTYPDAKGGFEASPESVLYVYDDAGRVASVGDYATAIDYELDGRVANLTYGNGVTAAMTYDESRRWLDSVTVTSPNQNELFAAHYGHDAVGRIHYINEANPTPTSRLHTFDDLGRLIQVLDSDPSRTERFSYDPIGRMRWSMATGDLSYGDRLHVHAPTSSDLGFARSYDVTGNVARLEDPKGRELDLTWNVDHTLASSTDASGLTTSFLYKSDGTRVQKSGKRGTSQWFGPLLELVDGRLVTYYMAGDRLLARRDGGQVSYYSQDVTHSTRLITDGNGRVTNRYDYSAFGRVNAAMEGVAQDREHGDGEHDDASGLTYLAARYYDPQLMHFVSADSIVPDLHDPQSLHRYSYAEQDPIDYWDPSGHMRASVERKKELQQEASAYWMYSEMMTCSTRFKCMFLDWQATDQYLYTGSLPNPGGLGGFGQKRPTPDAPPITPAAPKPSMSEPMGPPSAPFPETTTTQGVDPDSLHRLDEPPTPDNEPGIIAQLPPLEPKFDLGPEIKHYAKQLYAGAKRLVDPSQGLDFRIGKDLLFNLGLSGRGMTPIGFYDPDKPMLRRTGERYDHDPDLRPPIFGGVNVPRPMYPLLNTPGSTTINVYLEFRF